MDILIISSSVIMFIMFGINLILLVSSFLITSSLLNATSDEKKEDYRRKLCRNSIISPIALFLGGLSLGACDYAKRSDGGRRPGCCRNNVHQFFFVPKRQKNF